MSLIEKSDVKNHPSPPFHTRIHLCEPVSQPDATGFSEAESESEPVKANLSVFTQDFLAEHSSTVKPVDRVTVSDDPHSVKDPKSAQA